VPAQLVLVGALVSGSPFAFASTLADCAIEFELKGCPTVIATTTPDEATVSGRSPGGADNVGGEPSRAATPAEPVAEAPPPVAEVLRPSPSATPTMDDMGGLSQNLVVDEDAAGASIVRSPWEIIYVGSDDIASFRPGAGSAFMEPDGWTVRGLPANFWTDTSTQVVDGELFGGPASVRFTPVRYRWDFGDGDRVMRSDAGNPWDAQNLEEFAETPTSHSYAKSGTYVVQPSVDYSAEYRLGAGEEWIPITGVVTARTNPLAVVVTGASTVLVTKDCLSDPSGPGC